MDIRPIEEINRSGIVGARIKRITSGHNIKKDLDAIFYSKEFGLRHFHPLWDVVKEKGLPYSFEQVKDIMIIKK